MSGAILAILSAASFGLGHISLRRGVLRVIDPTVGVIINVPLSLPLFLIILAIMGRLHDIVAFPWQSYVWLSIAGLIHFFIGRMFSYSAVQLLGANLASMVARVSPIISATIGIAVLGEPLNWEVVAGVLLIVFGVVIVSVNPATFNRNRGSIPHNIPLRGILFALGNGVCFGITPVFIKIALVESLSSVAATFISYAVASIALVVLLLSGEKRAALFSLESKTFFHFYIAGLLSGIAQLLRYAALTLAPVSVVAPLKDTSPIFVVCFSFIFNRKIEIFSRYIIIGLIVTVLGAILLA